MGEWGFSWYIDYFWEKKKYIQRINPAHMHGKKVYQVHQYYFVDSY